MPSIREAIEAREVHLRAADQAIRSLAAELAGLIPSSMKKCAGEMSWYPGVGDPEYWKLPEFLQYLVSNTRAGGGNKNKFRKDELEVYGFRSFKELEAALRELEEAWKGLVRIKIEKESGCWSVYFFAAEIVAKER